MMSKEVDNDVSIVSSNNSRHKKTTFSVVLPTPFHLKTVRGVLSYENGHSDALPDLVPLVQFKKTWKTPK